jgi:hypothetical protein
MFEGGFMPVVLIDFTNRVWATEQPDDGYTHVGWAGKGGPRLLDVLEFVSARQKQFDGFVARKREKESRSGGGASRKKLTVSQPDHLRVSES